MSYKTNKFNFYDKSDQQSFCLFVYCTLMIEYIGMNGMSSFNFTLIMSIYMICYTFAFVSLVKNYFNLIVTKILVNIGIENTFRKALVLTFVNNIPRYIAYFIFTGIRFEDNTSMLNGITLFNMTIIVALSILNSRRSCFISQTSFFKDFIFIEVSLLYQCVYFQEKKVENVFLYLALILFLIFLINTFRLSGYLSTDEFANPQESETESVHDKIHRYTTKIIFDMLVLDPEDNSKFSERLSYRLFLSPFINAMILIGIIKEFRNFKGLLVGGFISVLIGIILVKFSKKQESGLFLNVYGVIASLLHIFLFTNRLPYTINLISLFYGVSVNYLLTTVVPLFLSLPELLSVLSLTQKNLFNLAICSVLYSVVFNILCLHSLRVIATQNEVVKNRYPGNNICFTFCIITTIVFVFNYIMKNQKLSRDLAYILIFIYSLFHLTYALDFNTYIKGIM